MKGYLLIFFLLILSKVWSQNLDSLLDVVSYLKHDTEKVELFYKEGFAYRAINPQYSYDCALNAEHLAKKAKAPYYLARAYNLLGVLYYRKGELTEALRFHKMALNIRTEIQDKKGVAISHTNLGNIYTDLRLFQLAERSYLLALTTNQDLRQHKQVDNCLLNLGVLQTELGNLGSAENYFNLALKNALSRFDYEMEASCLNNLGEIHLKNGDYDKAIAVSVNSLKVKALMENDMEMADSYLTLASVYIKKKQSEQAKGFLQKADSLILKYDYFDAYLQSLLVYAAYYELGANYASAYKSLAAYQTIKDSLIRATAIEESAYHFSNNLRQEQNQKSFPIRYLTTLFSIFVFVIFLVMKHKK